MLDTGAYGFTESMPLFLSHPVPAEVTVSRGIARVARLHFVHGLGIAEIAARMRIDPVTVDRCLWVVRQRPSSRRS